MNDQFEPRVPFAFVGCMMISCGVLLLVAFALAIISKGW